MGCCCSCCKSSDIDPEGGPLSPTWSSPPTSPKSPSSKGGNFFNSFSPKNLISPKGGKERRSFFGRASNRGGRNSERIAEEARLAAAAAARAAELDKFRTRSERLRCSVANEFTDMESIIRLLRAKNAPVRLVRPRFFQRTLHLKEPMGCRQELPEQAFVPLDKYTDDELRERLDVIAISYLRLDAAHPDPDMCHLETICKMLDCFTRGTQKKAKAVYKPFPNNPEYSAAYLKRLGYHMGAGAGERIVGVFMDWVSIYQDKPRNKYTGEEILRTSEQLKASEEALKNMSIWYAHRRSIVWMLNYLPPDQKMRPSYTDGDGEFHPEALRSDFSESGWTTFERSIAGFLTRPGDLLNVTWGMRQRFLTAKVSLTAKKEDNGEFVKEPDDVVAARAILKGDYVQMCICLMDRERGMPCVPGDFNELIRTKAFANDEAETGDRDAVAIPEYRRVFDAVVENAEVMSFADMGIGSETAMNFLRQVVDKGYCKNVTSLDMSGNRVGLPVGSWGKALAEGAPNLQRLVLSDNGNTAGELMGLTTLTNLTELHLDGTKVTGDVKCLGALKQLRSVFLHGSEVTGDVGSLIVLRELEELVLCWTKVHGELGSLSQMQSLKTVNLWFTKVPLVGTKDALRGAIPDVEVF